MTGDAVRDVAGVWVNDTLAARIVKQNGVNTFSYVEGYAEAGGSAVATTLPLGKEVATTSGALPPFFTGLLPEGRRLSALRRTLKASLDDELTLLLAVGGNTVGNVSVLPWGQPPSELPPLVDVSDGHGNFAELLDPAAEHDAHALAGVQEKASARTPALPVRRDAILNPRASSRSLSRTNRRAWPPSARCLRCEGAWWRHGSCAIARGGRAWSCPVLTVIFLTSVPSRTRRNCLAFAWLSGNGDLHAKNVSVMDSGRGFELTPVYDIPSTLPYGDTSLALAVRGSTSGLSYKKFNAFASELGLPERVIRRVADEALAATATLAQQLIQACDFDPRRARDLERVLRARRAHW